MGTEYPGAGPRRSRAPRVPRLRSMDPSIPRTAEPPKGEAIEYRGHIPELDGLRVTILFVVLNHTWPTVLSRTHDYLDVAWILMDTFFVLSGFLIAGILLDSRDEVAYYRPFFTRRAARILPLYYLLLAGLFVIDRSMAGSGHLRMVADWGSPWWFWVYLGNFPTALAGSWPVGGGGGYGPLWSLQIEEQFYLLFPVLVRKLRTATLVPLLIGLALLSPLLRIALFEYDRGNVLAPYVLLPTHMEGIAMGALVAVWLRSRAVSIRPAPLTIATFGWLALTVMVAVRGGYAHDEPINRTAGYLLASIANAHLLLWLLRFRGSRVTAAFRLAPVRFIGKISYGIYLLHVPVLFLVTSAGTALGIAALTAGFSRLAVAVLLTIALAGLSWHFMETPLRTLARGRRPGTTPRPPVR